MRRPLFLTLLASSLINALPLHSTAPSDQQLLQPPNLLHPLSALSQHLERIPRSAELLFTTNDNDSLVHIWLPLGKRIHARDYPILPLHPTTARLVNILGMTNEATASDEEREVTCIIRPRVSMHEMDLIGESHESRDVQEEISVVIRQSDGLAGFEEAASPWFLGGREVDSYECF